MSKHTIRRWSLAIGLIVLVNIFASELPIVQDNTPWVGGLIGLSCYLIALGVVND